MNVKMKYPFIISGKRIISILYYIIKLISLFIKFVLNLYSTNTLESGNDT